MLNCLVYRNEKPKPRRKRLRGSRPKFEHQKVARLADYAQKGQFLIRFCDIDEEIEDKIWCVEDHILLRSWIRVPGMEMECGKRVYRRNCNYTGWWPHEKADYYLISTLACRMIDEKHVEIDFPCAEAIAKEREKEEPPRKEEPSAEAS
ncbi:hypothetical protein QR680_012612 [Steinernema hermaphroditum]|uniref:Uncharacterized protein n=1 Tax=Steinernema hermaphroditum TaxID=289476 RepID=A0AA39I4K6_9BILA|nr:hypothetical protein QR680_012612 [Steinernema hermaphroditum]